MKKGLCFWQGPFFLKTIMKEYSVEESETGRRKKPPLFTRIAEKASNAAGSPVAFIVAFLLVLVWAVTGPFFDYSETWQIVINTATTIITFLLVFLIQNSQNRETKAVQIKLDELIRATEGAHNTILHVEKLTDKELDVLSKNYEELAETACNDSDDDNRS